MNAFSKTIIAAAVILTTGLSVAARAEVVYEYPAQFAIQSRQIHVSQPMNCHMAAMDGDEMKLDVTVKFATGSDKLDKHAVVQVARAAAMIKKHHHLAHVLVEGNTDTKGNAAKNQDLSYRRALRVVHTLVEKYGIPADLVVAKGFGGTKPIATNSTPAGREANRRVEFVIIKE